MINHDRIAELLTEEWIKGGRQYPKPAYSDSFEEAKIRDPLLSTHSIIKYARTSLGYEGFYICWSHSNWWWIYSLHNGIIRVLKKVWSELTVQEQNELMAELLGANNGS